MHCRAEAIPHRSPHELTTAEGKRLIDRVAAFGDPPPILVLTGGNPLRRPDITEIVAWGTARGISVSLSCRIKSFGDPRIALLLTNSKGWR